MKNTPPSALRSIKFIKAFNAEGGEKKTCAYNHFLFLCRNFVKENL